MQVVIKYKGRTYAGPLSLVPDNDDDDFTISSVARGSCRHPSASRPGRVAGMLYIPRHTWCVKRTLLVLCEGCHSACLLCCQPSSSACFAVKIAAAHKQSVTHLSHAELLSVIGRGHAVLPQHGIKTCGLVLQLTLKHLEPGGKARLAGGGLQHSALTGRTPAVGIHPPLLN